jgi:hypothetical protein
MKLKRNRFLTESISYSNAAVLWLQPFSPAVSNLEALGIETDKSCKAVIVEGITTATE